MGQLYETIRQHIADGRYVVGEHASERLEERGIMEWQAVAGFDDGELICERPKATPNPAIEVRESLPNGTEFKVVAVDVELVVPADDPSEPCYESETVQLLREVKERAERGDIARLKQHGKVYAALDAA